MAWFSAHGGCRVGVEDSIRRSSLSEHIPPGADVSSEDTSWAQKTASPLPRIATSAKRSSSSTPTSLFQVAADAVQDELEVFFDEHINPYLDDEFEENIRLTDAERTDLSSKLKEKAQKDAKELEKALFGLRFDFVPFVVALFTANIPSNPGAEVEGEAYSRKTLESDEQFKETFHEFFRLLEKHKQELSSVGDKLKHARESLDYTNRIVEEWVGDNPSPRDINQKELNGLSEKIHALEQQWVTIKASPGVKVELLCSGSPDDHCLDTLDKVADKLALIAQNPEKFEVYSLENHISLLGGQNAVRISETINKLAQDAVKISEETHQKMLETRQKLLDAKEAEKELQREKEEAEKALQQEEKKAEKVRQNSHAVQVAAAKAIAAGAAPEPSVNCAQFSSLFEDHDLDEDTTKSFACGALGCFPLVSKDHAQKFHSCGSYVFSEVLTTDLDTDKWAGHSSEDIELETGDAEANKALNRFFRSSSSHSVSSEQLHLQSVSEEQFMVKAGYKVRRPAVWQKIKIDGGVVQLSAGMVKHAPYLYFCR